MFPIYGFQKTTLLDYPGHLASIIFLGHCNFRCPYCHNSTLLTPTDHTVPISLDSILAYLEKRRSVLQGVCISGGEPTLQKELPLLLSSIKSMGYLTKLDTNGTNPTMIHHLIQENLLDMVAMDIKHTPEKYAQTIGISSFDMTPVLESIELLKQSNLSYEFRTTLVKEYHALEDMPVLGQLLHGDSPYFLQNYKDGPTVLQPGLHGFTPQELKEYQKLLLPYVPNTFLR